MFNFRIQDFTWMMIKTLLIVVLLDFLSSSFFPTFQMTYLFPSFHLLILIYLSFFQPAHRLPILVLIIESVHSIFTVEGWALGTITSCIIVNILVLIRDTIQFSSFLATFLLVYAVQILWAVISGTLLAIKLENWYIVESYFKFSLVQGIVLGLVALPFFKLLEKIWDKEDRSSFTADQVF
jgi:hypothetical protein